MKSLNPVPPPTDNNCRRPWFCHTLPAVSFLFLIFFIGSAFIIPDYKQKLSRWGMAESFQNLTMAESFQNITMAESFQNLTMVESLQNLTMAESFQNLTLHNCKKQCRPPGSEALPEGIVSKTSNLEFRKLWGASPKLIDDNGNLPGLLAMAVGIKQSDLVDEMVKKFLSSKFSVMLFHYDGVVDQWRNFEWCDHVVHVSAFNQTKWWFAKRFLHPDIVSTYNYIFLWDEDLGVQNFDLQKYLSIIEREGLEISQPALDPKSEIHTQITKRLRKSIVHRRTFKRGLCDENSKGPPCTGWVEMMAPVFSKSAWRCVWYMIQNDLVHAWGLDYQLGYCSQGDRTKNIGVVDAEYVMHYGRPTLGGKAMNKTTSSILHPTSNSQNATSALAPKPYRYHRNDPRLEVRRQSHLEYKIFVRRWKGAVEDAQCWTDPYK